jgi:hypothetical protein
MYAKIKRKMNLTIIFYGKNFSNRYIITLFVAENKENIFKN